MPLPAPGRPVTIPAQTSAVRRAWRATSTRWGLIPYLTKDLKRAGKPINAKSETIAKSGMF
jgi:putative SOS response-associated peptidase YedK